MDSLSHTRRRGNRRRWLSLVARAWMLWTLYFSPSAARLAWPWLLVRARLLPADLRHARAATVAQRLMEQQNETTSETSADTAQAKAQANGAGPESERKPVRVQRILLVRHGQSTFNVEGRLPSQLPNVTLTDEGRRQAHQAAVALAGLDISAVISSPLERARETAEIIARGWDLPVREEPRLMDTEMGRWAGRKISEVSKDDPEWLKFVARPTEPPDGVEGFEQVRQRVVAAIEDLRADPTAGDDVVVVAHADVIKLIVAHYTKLPVDSARFIVIGNASISALAFTEGYQPTLLAVNWTMAPHWLVSPSKPAAAAQASPEADKLAQQDGRPVAEELETGAPSGVIM